MATTKKARARKALRYAWRTQHINGITHPPVVSIALAHHYCPDHFPLRTQHQWQQEMYGQRHTLTATEAQGNAYSIS